MEQIGQVASGAPVHRVEIAGGGLRARVLSWGAVIQDLRLDGHPAPLVLGFEEFAHYPAHSPYFGAIAGRYANRIAGARFPLDGQTHRTDANFLGRHTLHGGREGIGKRIWRIAEARPDRVRLRLTDPDGAMGFPGTLEIACTYLLAPEGRLSVTLEATTDAPTLCNLAHHSYFNLDDGGAGDILDHRLAIAAERYLPVDLELIPTGEIAPVDGTPFDFRTPRPIRQADADGQLGYDHNFCLAPARRALTHVATLQAARSGLAMEVRTTEPGLQFYAGRNIAPPVPGLGGRRYGAFAGLALEPQVWPDAPNRPAFPQAVLRPRETYLQTTEYRFLRR